MNETLDSTQSLHAQRASVPRIVAVASGKGGVGKSVFVANLGLALAGAGHRVLLVDTDLEGSNLHTLLGVERPNRGLLDYASHRQIDLEKLVVTTDRANLHWIAGTPSGLAVASSEPLDTKRLLLGLRRFPADWVLLDLPSGARARCLELFLGADEAIVMLTPVPTAVENTHQFLRAAYFGRIWQAMQTTPIRALISSVLEGSDERGLRSPLELLSEVERIDREEGRRFRETARRFSAKLLVNRVRTAEEIKLGFSMRCVCRKYFGSPVEYLGYVNADPLVGVCVAQGRPVVEAHPRSDAAIYVRRIAQKLCAEAGFAAREGELEEARVGGFEP